MSLVCNLSVCLLVMNESLSFWYAGLPGCSPVRSILCGHWSIGLYIRDRKSIEREGKREWSISATYSSKLGIAASIRLLIQQLNCVVDIASWWPFSVMGREGGGGEKERKETRGEFFQAPTSEGGLRGRRSEKGVCTTGRRCSQLYLDFA